MLFFFFLGGGGVGGGGNVYNVLLHVNASLSEG